MKNRKLRATDETQMFQEHAHQQEEYQKILAEKVMEIFRENQLSRDEIRALYGADLPGVSGQNIDRAAERIIALFIKEKLTIEEGKNVLQGVMDGLAGEGESALAESDIKPKK